jgi:prepilin-type processing-associated H-X9-DG protein
LAQAVNQPVKRNRSLAPYASNVHVIGGNTSRKLADITDGLENTLLVGQAIDNLKPWGQPINWRDPALGINQSPTGFGNAPRTGALFVFADGHVKFLTSDTSPALLRALGTPDAAD